MKKNAFLLTMAIAITLVISSCGKEKDPPVVSTTAISSITSTTATSGGNVTAAGTSAVTARGVCWATTANPTITNSKTTDGNGVGTFTSTMSGLNPGTVYHVRSYATNAEGTSYGNNVTFTTQSLIKSIQMASGTDVEKWDFTYDAATKRVSKMLNYWNTALDKDYTYDYSVPGKLTVKKADNTVWADYEINAQGYITKIVSGSDAGRTFQYDANGYLVKLLRADGTTIREMTVTNGVINRWTTYIADGVTASQIKEFTYTIGNNVNGIQETNAISSNWRPIGDVFGKASPKLVDFLDYWDPRVTPVVKLRTTMTYVFDASNRPSTITRAGTGWQEVFTYTYH